jgi:hypothetical protein
MGFHNAGPFRLENTEPYRYPRDLLSLDRRLEFLKKFAARIGGMAGAYRSEEI